MTIDQTVPCKWCGTPTRMLGTKECDRHWELRTRVTAEPEMAKRMLGLISEAAAADADIYEKHHMQMLLDERSE